MTEKSATTAKGLMVPTAEDVRNAQQRLLRSDINPTEPFSRPPFPFCLRETPEGHWELYVPLSASSIEEATAAAWVIFLKIANDDAPSNDELERWSRGVQP